jgi:hypothetical protein
MPQNYNGSTAGITGHPTVTISEPLGSDVRNATSVVTPLRRLADFVQYVATYFALSSEVDADIATHNAVTNPHSATSAATADRIVLRDASGRSAFASPAWSAIPAAANWATTTAQASKNAEGRVFLRGRFTNSTSPSATMGTIPAGLRPAAGKSYAFSLPRSGGGTQTIATVFDTGVVQVTPVATGDAVDIDGISFPTD